MRQGGPQKLESREFKMSSSLYNQKANMQSDALDGGAVLTIEHDCLKPRQDTHLQTMPGSLSH